MSSFSLRNRSVSRTVFTSAALLLMPLAVQAQTAVQPPKSYEDAQKIFAVNRQHYEETHKSILITVDYVDVSPFDLLTASQAIPAGPQHDALLLTALVKAGAHDTHGTPVQTWDGTTVERGGVIVVLETAPVGSPWPQYLQSSTKAVAQFNSDSTVSVSLKLRLERVGPVPTVLPALGERPEQTIFLESAVVLSDELAKLTFRNGQTLAVRSVSGPAAAHTHTINVAFVRVKIVPGQELTLSPGLALPVTPPALPPPARPRSIDPGMVGAPKETSDQSMVIGRGMKPEQMDHMNAFQPSVPASK